MLRRPSTVFLFTGFLAVLGCVAEQEPARIPPPPAPQASEVPVPEFAIGLWPGEGIPEFEAVGSTLVLHATASTAAKLLDTLRPPVGSRIEYDSTRYVTIMPARISVLRADTISGRDFGAVMQLSRETYQSTVPHVDIGVTPDTEVELLQHRAEGACFVRVADQVIEASPCPLFDVGAFRPEGQPETAWWIFVPEGTYGGGWVEVTDSTVRLAGRRF